MSDTFNRSAGVLFTVQNLKSSCNAQSTPPVAVISVVGAKEGSALKQAGFQLRFEATASSLAGSGPRLGIYLPTPHATPPDIWSLACLWRTPYTCLAPAFRRCCLCVAAHPGYHPRHRCQRQQCGHCPEPRQQHRHFRLDCGRAWLRLRVFGQHGAGQLGRERRQPHHREARGATLQRPGRCSCT